MNGTDEVKARKQHTCDLCRKKIKKGEVYHRQNITPWDHPDNECFSTVKAHLECWDKWLEVGHESGWLFPEDEYEWNEIVNGRKW